ncbi:MAG: hypothetical protein Q9219_004454 [cf. Caloplaca sp. 3 TL-2023]
MSIEASHLQRAASPALSGRSSPVEHKRRTEDEGPVKLDKAARRYAAGIDRALTLFDNDLQDWADYLPFLGRLLKALQVHPPGISDVPQKTLVAQRLSQCLNPALPSGVHQKALEVYTYIFSLIGKNGLGRDLPHYLPGLSPVLAFASLSTKPSLLALFDTFIVPLDPDALRPALKAILLALLPGLEEESSEEFERTHAILQHLREAISHNLSGTERVQDPSGDQFFWQCLFLATITSPSRRQGALAFLQRHLPRLGKSVDAQNPDDGHSGEHQRKLSNAIKAVTSPEPGLLIRCFVAGLSDPQVLIQRGFLDMLVTHLPLHSDILHRSVTFEDLVRLVESAVSVVLRREMSLNRRLWAWFLGSKEVSTDHQEAVASSYAVNGHKDRGQGQGEQLSYFQRHGLSALVQGIVNMLEMDAATPGQKARPFRIALALMDRWEIGSLVAPMIFLPSLTSVWRYQRTAPGPEEFGEVLRSAKALFDGVESALIWEEISNKLLHATEMQVPDFQAFHENLELASFVISNFDIQEEDMVTRHIPPLVLSLLLKFKYLYFHPPDQGKAPAPTTVEKTISFATRLLDKVPERVFTIQPSQRSKTSSLSGDALEAENQVFLAGMRELYQRGQGTARSKIPDIDKSLLVKLFVSNAVHLLAWELLSNKPSGFFDSETAMLEKILRRMPSVQLQDVTELISAISEALENLATSPKTFAALKRIFTFVSLLEAMRATLPDTSWLHDHRLRLILSNILTGLWHFLSPANPKSNLEAVRYVWKVHSLSTDKKLVESCISAFMIQSSAGFSEGIQNIENAQRFAILWTHSNIIHGSHARRSSLPPSAPKYALAKGNAVDEETLSRPLLLLLDTLNDPKTGIFSFMTGWLQLSINVQKIVELLQKKLEKTQLVDVSGTETSGSEAEAGDNPIDVNECLYYLQTMSNVIEHSPSEIWPSLLARSRENGHIDMLETKRKHVTVQNDVPDKRSNTASTQICLTRTCVRYLSKGFEEKIGFSPSLSRLQQTAAFVLEEIVLRSTSLVDLEAELESPVLTALSWSIEKPDHSLQVALMSLLSVMFRRRLDDTGRAPDNTHRRALSSENNSQKSVPRVQHEKEEPHILPGVPPPMLLDCLFKGLASTGSHPVLSHWIRFLDLCLPFYMSNIFQILMPLVDCLMKTLHSLFGDLQASFRQPNIQATASIDSVNTIIELMNGLEQVLAQAHGFLGQHEIIQNSTKPPEQAQGFFGNMVSGVFPMDVYKSRSAGANDRLTVLLCFKDAVKLCLRIWSWGKVLDNSGRDPTLIGSFNHTSLRLKNRSRRILEHIFTAEALECLETFISSWRTSQTLLTSEVAPTSVLDLLHVLDGSRPRNTIPAIFNSLYSRTNPGALDPERKSTLTSELSDVEIALFLVEYTRSLEDDAMDEIWGDCMAFLKDVLTNPLPHRQTLPKLLEFTALLGIKIDNTSFGENRKRRRELADLFLRQLTATFTTKPISFASEPFPPKGQKLLIQQRQPSSTQSEAAGGDIVAVLATIFQEISKILVDSDRITTASNIVSAQVVIPTIRWKTFPRNITFAFLELLLSMTRVAEASKAWRKDVAEAFNDSRFFYDPSYQLAFLGWLPLLREWINSDKGRMDELLTRILPPTSAGIVFGVGASSARLEADRKTQLYLRRMATLLLAASNDGFVVHLAPIQEKIMALLNATAASSPSSATRAEIYMVLRALILKNQPIHLASWWPGITTELHAALSTLYPGRHRDKYNMHCIVHACKLLDVLVVVAPDDFQMRQWLFVTDTIDAVYRPQGQEPHALVDDLIDDLDEASAGTLQSATIHAPSASQIGSRKPLLTNQVLQGIPAEDLLDRAIRPFLRQISINSFEGIYSMTPFDWQAVHDDLLYDIFDDKSLV